MKWWFLLAACLLTLQVQAQNAWINEIHYDNLSGDTGEFLEIVLEDAGSFTLSDFTITLYNSGTGGFLYDTRTLDVYAVGETTTGGFTVYSFDYTANGASIQNGSADGMAISYQGALIQFLCYEGTMTAADGDAAGQTCTDIGVSEPGTTAAGSSLQLTGTGTQYADFVWAGESDDSPGLVNTGQMGLPVELISFTARTNGPEVLLEWATASETGNAGFEVQHLRAGIFQPVGFVEGHGTTTYARQYRYQMADLQPGHHRFRLKQVDLDGTVAYSPEVEVAVELATHYALGAAWPNPFNPQTQFEVTVRETQPVTITLYNLLGQSVAELFRGELAANVPHTVRIDGTGLASGVYVYRVQGTHFLATKTVTLAK